MSEHRIEVANCKRHGDFEQKVWIMCPGPDAFEMRAPHSCPKCVDEREAERRTRQRLERIAYNRQRANIPRRFADCSIDNYEAITTAQRTALNTAKAFAENFAAVVAAGSSLTFCGPSGTGKTHLACAIANHVLDAGGTVIYEQAIELIRKIRETWRRDSHETEVEVIGRYRAVDLLILDEIGVSFGGEAEKTQLFDVLDGRYRELRPMLVICNLDAQGLQESVGPRIYDRLLENGSAVVLFDGKSYRRKPPSIRPPKPKPTESANSNYVEKPVSPQRVPGASGKEKPLSKRLEEMEQLFPHEISSGDATPPAMTKIHDQDSGVDLWVPTDEVLATTNGEIK